jgi:hypothetical protein
MEIQIILRNGAVAVLPITRIRTVGGNDKIHLNKLSNGLWEIVYGKQLMIDFDEIGQINIKKRCYKEGIIRKIDCIKKEDYIPPVRKRRAGKTVKDCVREILLKDSTVSGFQIAKYVAKKRKRKMYLLSGVMLKEIREELFGKKKPK